MRSFYENQIAILTQKNQILQANAQKRNRSVILSTENSTSDIKQKKQSRLMRTNSFSRTLNRSKSKQNMKNPPAYIPFKKSHENSLQISFFRKMIVQSSIWDNSFIEQFQKLVTLENKEIENFIFQIQAINANIQKQQNSSSVQTKVKELIKTDQTNKIIHNLCSLIENMRIYQEQLEGIILGAGSKINKLYEEKQFTQHQSSGMHHITQQIMEVTSKWKEMSSIKFMKMKQENKELREIIQEMIGLMNKKKGQNCLDSRSLPS